MKKETELARQNESLLFRNQKIEEVNMEHEVKKSFIEYSMSVIIARALPDVRDGLKPGQRRVLYEMYEDHLTHDKPFRKSATTVGKVLGLYHPHGDSSVYGTMVHLAQPFYMRHPLIEGQGNFGSVDGDPPAAYRYTEARMAKIANEMLRDIDKEAVRMVPNFDNSRKEPEVLPARFPNLLVNGSMGIAVGMATNIPTHNLGEVIDATVFRMEHPDCTVSQLMERLPGPDFPTYGTIYGTSGIREAYMTGKGRITVRAKAEVNEDNRQIVVTEIPYGVNKSQLCEAIGALVKEKRVEGITDIRDESDRDGMRVVVDFRRDANGHVLLNQLFRYTQLQSTCAVNLLAIVDNEPKVLTLPQILDSYIAHQESVITNRVRFDLRNALHDVLIFEGYKLALDNLDEVISIIRSSPDTPTAKLNLMERFKGPARGELDLAEFAAAEDPGLTEEQAQAIVSLTLGRLSGLERQKIEDRLSELRESVREYRAILADEGRIREIIKDELLDVRDRYADARRTRIETVENEIIDEDLVERHNCVVTLTNAGYIKRLPADTYSAQRRGGKGVMGMATKEEDFIEKVVSVHSHSTILMFTNRGRVQTMRAFRIPEAGRTAKGTNVVNLLQLEPGERVTAMIDVDGFDGEGGEYLTMVTRRGVIKRTLLSCFAYQRKGGKKALTLDEGDELLVVLRTRGDDEILIATAGGKAVRFPEACVRPTGRTARGVVGITLRSLQSLKSGPDGDDEVVGAVVVDEDRGSLVTVTRAGFGKRTPFSCFRTMLHRGGSGVVCQKVTAKTGLLAGVVTAEDGDDLMMITDQGTVIRTPAADVSAISRSGAGVIVMRLPEGQYVANVTKVAQESSEVEEGESGETGEDGTGETGGGAEALPDETGEL